MDEWGETLRDRRRTAGLSADQLGARAGVSGETVRRIERGESTSTLTQSKINRALDRGSHTDRIDALERQIGELHGLVVGVLLHFQRAGVLPPPTQDR